MKTLLFYPSEIAPGLEASRKYGTKIANWNWLTVAKRDTSMDKVLVKHQPKVKYSLPPSPNISWLLYLCFVCVFGVAFFSKVTLIHTSKIWSRLDFLQFGNALCG